MYLDDERRPTLTPQLALRVAVIGGVALVAFAVIFFRLWYLQVLSGDKYLAEARGNQVRSIKVQAPRGEIVDRNGRVLVDNTPGRAVVVTPDKLPEDSAERQVLYQRLGKLLRIRPRRIAREVDQQLKAQPFAAATVKGEVGDAYVRYLLEHQDDFPGVSVEQVFLRDYPHHEIGAHLFGTVGEVSAEELKETRFRGVESGDRVGKSGIELRVRQLPARDQRRESRAGGRARQPQAHADPAQPAPGPAAAAVGRPRRAAGRPGGARDRHRQGRLRGHGRQRRAGARARLPAVVRPERVREDRQAAGPTIA